MWNSSAASSLLLAGHFNFVSFILLSEPSAPVPSEWASTQTHEERKRRGWGVTDGQRGRKEWRTEGEIKEAGKLISITPVIYGFHSDAKESINCPDVKLLTRSPMNANTHTHMHAHKQCTFFISSASMCLWISPWPLQNKDSEQPWHNVDLQLILYVFLSLHPP